VRASTEGGRLVETEIPAQIRARAIPRRRDDRAAGGRATRGWRGFGSKTTRKISLYRVDAPSRGRVGARAGVGARTRN
jgi:hypothetical protein